MSELPEAIRRLATPEAEEKLRAYAALLLQWNQRMNLIGKTTEADLWQRHILDSAQLFPLIPEGAETLLDFGSGAGFPGMVLALLGVKDVHLVESTGRKIGFLEEVARVTETPVSLHHARVEALDPFPAQVITARAVASLEQCLHYAAPFLTPNTLCLWLKGARAKEELTHAEKHWKMRTSFVPSATSDAREPGWIISMTEVMPL